jgi:hypothetical protein
MENNRNQQNQSDTSQSSTGQNRNTSDQDINVENPQRGGQWENYQTRELSSNAQPGSKTTVAGADSGSERPTSDQDQGI